jgi:glutamate-ammonia-ligase adenylyltransferase
MLYYESRGELWERQMLIKARRVAGDEELGSRLLERLRPFVYPRSLFANPLNEIARIKARIEVQSGDTHNIKLCSGGIRDIEFIVQALQLMNGGRSPELRTGTTTDAIERLETRGLLSGEEALILGTTYRFYRTIEHRLQMLEYAQTHSIPADPAERTKLAFRLEMRLPAFDRSLKHSLSDVRRIFDAVFAVETLTAPSDVERLLLEQHDSDFAQKFCSKYHLEDRISAVKRLRRMLYGSGLSGMKEYTEQTRSNFRAIVPQLLVDIGRTVSPDQTLARCEQIFSSFPAIDSLYTALANPSLCTAVTTLCGKSPWITRILMNNRFLIDYVITRLPEIASGVETSFPKTITHRSLVEWKLHSELSAVTRYLLGIIDEQTMFAHVSDAAERILAALFTQQRRRLRLPSATSMCVLALGKLGGKEISPGSDLDIIFIFRAKTKADAARCERLAAALLEQASAVTPEGSLYDVDARLRPEGKNAPLAISLKTYKKYFQHRASLWERQSLTRVRIIAGDAKLAGDIEAFLLDSVYGASLPPHWRAAILAMRKKTEARSHTRTTEYFDVKLSAGGLMDIEFAAQSLQLAAGLEAVASTNTYELLKEYGRRMPMILPLVENYTVLRRLETALRLGLDQPSAIVPMEKTAQKALASWMNIQNAEDLTAYIRSIAKQNRSILELVLTQDQ